MRSRIISLAHAVCDKYAFVRHSGKVNLYSQQQNLNIKWTHSDIFINETTLCLAYEIREVAAVYDYHKLKDTPKCLEHLLVLVHEHLLPCQ